MTSLDHAAACELAEKRAIAVYGAVFASLTPDDGVLDDNDKLHAHRAAERAAAAVPRPAPFRVPTALERQQAVQDWDGRK